LLDLFPQARFVHIVRSPYVVIPSTIHTWQTLYRTFGLQQPTFDGLEEQVFANYLHMFHKLEETCGLIEPSRFYELRYEDLLQDPIGHIGALYAHLTLGDLTPALPLLRQYVADTASYQTNRYALSPALRDTITQRLGHVIQRYGYG
jgi:omega-hydroxy-beta-dihydromenaquinone-9 sulfotransferase